MKTLETEVTAVVEKLRLAMIASDSSVLESITAECLSYGHSGGKIESKSAFVDCIVSGRSVFLKIALTNQTITITNDVAIVRHLFVADTNDSGLPAQVKILVLLIWQKLDSQWKLIARQAVKAL